MLVDQTTLDEVLQPYKPECRYLVEARLEYPEIDGLFRIPQSFYVIEDTGHLNAVDMLICYNQLAYTLFAEAGKRGLIENWGEISLDDFKEHQIRNCVIVCIDNVRFRKPISPQEFRGMIKLGRMTTKREGTLNFFKTFYDFEKGSATGEIDVALVR